MLIFSRNVSSRLESGGLFLNMHYILFIRSKGICIAAASTRFFGKAARHLKAIPAVRTRRNNETWMILV